MTGGTLPVVGETYRWLPPRAYEGMMWFVEIHFEILETWANFISCPRNNSRSALLTKHELLVCPLLT